VSPSQLVTVVGGKWTIYRHVAENIVDTAASIAGLPAQCSISKDLKIHGWLPTDLIANMQNSPWNYYGSDCPDVERLAAGDLRKLEPIHPSLPCREVDVLWAVQYEMARQVEDVLMRRGRSLLLGARESLTIAPRVAAIMAKALGRDLTWQRTQIDHYQKTKGVTWLY
jgi:glycerol-3-phosphate dehydrogenase